VTISPLKLTLLTAGLLLGGITVESTVAPQEAQAQVRIHVGGRAHVRIGGHRVRGARYRYVRPWRRHYVQRPVIHVGGHIWLGGGYYYERPFAQPPPPPAPPAPAACNCGPEYYGPIAPAPAPVAASVIITDPEPRLPRWGFGAFMGGVSVDGEHEGEDLGLVGQLRLTKGLLVEGEIAENTLEDGGRVDRRFMIGLNYELGAHRKLAPYITAGIGTSQVEVEDGAWEDNQALAEIGGGLRWRLSDRLALFGDIRFGSRSLIDNEDEPRPIEPPSDATGRSLIPNSEEDYSRVRLGGMITF
jgi:hypothetical protein